jgi:hypothetical protein
VLPQGIDLDLVATVLVVDDGAERAVWCEVELVVITREQSDAIRAAIASELNIDNDHVRLSLSHNHAGPPPTSWDWATEGKDTLELFYASLPSRLAGAARQAAMSMRPARVGWARGENHVAVNRRETAPGGRPITGVNPDGAIDPDLLVLRIDGLDGEPIGSIAGYTMHPTFLGPTNTLLSPDWPGHMRHLVERVTGVPCLFAQGAAGDIGPGPKGFRDDLRAVRALGAQVGAEATRVFYSIETPDVRFEHERVQESGAPLGLWRSVSLETPEPVVRARAVDIELPLREQLPLAEADRRVLESQEQLRHLRNSNAPDSEVEAATFVVKRATMTRSRSLSYAGRKSTMMELHMLQIGPVVFVGVEGEPFSATGLRVKEESPFAATWFGGYTGGWAGYIPTPEEVDRGGYEVDTSPFARHAATVLEEQVLTSLRSFWTDGKP